ncbi:CAP domain-containing protein [Stomatobaculum longum]|uniref:CAP domain-containing protein n=1 Tax=Stomatobaculum longum TaxID=796942 RepID=UPI0028E83958|nr:CAP domain-containing protein [Stomatobaculum longum]
MKLLRKFVCAASIAAISACLVIPSMAATAQWKRNDKGWWYEEANGSYPTATWKLINNKWYYFDGIGYMAESRWIGNYYVGADGAMLVSTVTPDGYYVDETGKWMEGKRASLHVSKSSAAGKRRSGGGGGSSRGRRGGGGGGGSRSGGGSGLSYGGGVAAGNTANTGNVGTSGNGDNASNTANGGNASNTGNAGNSATTAGAAGTQLSGEEGRVISALMAMGLSEKEAKLYYGINAYRESLGLPKLSLSKSLTTVARTHVADSNAHTPENQVDARGIQGNLHSWSSYGSWTPVVYTSDHNYAAYMWSKPSELTSYPGSGFEISAWYSLTMTPEVALDSWKGSPGHNAVMTTQGMWSDLKTMGVGIDGKYAHVWFGQDADPAGYYEVTGYSVLQP